MLPRLRNEKNMSKLNVNEGLIDSEFKKKFRSQISLIKMK